MLGRMWPRLPQCASTSSWSLRSHVQRRFLNPHHVVTSASDAFQNWSLFRASQLPRGGQIPRRDVTVTDGNTCSSHSHHVKSSHSLVDCVYEGIVRKGQRTRKAKKPMRSDTTSKKNLPETCFDCRLKRTTASLFVNGPSLEITKKSVRECHGLCIATPTQIVAHR